MYENVLYGRIFNNMYHWDVTIGDNTVPSDSPDFECCEDSEITEVSNIQAQVNSHMNIPQEKRTKLLVWSPICKNHV